MNLFKFLIFNIYLVARVKNQYHTLCILHLYLHLYKFIDNIDYLILQNVP